jgi:hypothetical protein
MTLYNKDGTVYKLNGPNPIMNSQDIWEDYTLHNMAWDEEKHQGKPKVNPIQSDIKIRDNFVEELEATKNEDVKLNVDLVERKSQVAPKVEIKTSSSENQIDKVFVHCLPATIREKKDHLYGESYQTIQYGDPWSFEAVIIEENDLDLTLWTDVRDVTIGSVIFPKINSKRWWRVQSKEQKTQGWLISAAPSDFQPSFEV